MQKPRKLAANSTLAMVSSFNDRQYIAPMPCIVYGLYFEATGTIILESIYCDGQMFVPAEVDESEREKFIDELKHAAMFGDF